MTNNGGERPGSVVDITENSKLLIFCHDSNTEMRIWYQPSDHFGNLEMKKIY